MHVVGVDVGGTKIRAVLATGPSWVLGDEHEVATDRAGGEAVARQIVEVVRVAAGPSLEDVEVVGVGTPGAVDPVSGRTTLSQNIAGLDTFDLATFLDRELGRPVRFENDANLAAVAECWRGRAVGMTDVTVVSVGTGIGGGSIVGGTLLRGAHGGAGELADLPLVGDPFDPRSQRAGVFEREVGTEGLVRRYREAGGPPVASAREVFAAADEGEEVAAAVIDAAGRDVALGIVAVTAMVDPGLVVLAGGVGAAPRFVRSVADALSRATTRPVELAVSALGDRAALIGAVALAVGFLDAEGRLTVTPAREHEAIAPEASTRVRATTSSWYASEIEEQPAAVGRVIERAPSVLRTWLAGVPPTVPFLLLARGTSDHAATYGRYLLARLAGRDALFALPSLTTVHDLDPARHAAVLGISQSGRSPDLVHVMRRATSLQWPTLAVVNDVDAPLAVAADAVLDLGCGPERAVAATKSYAASLAALAVLAVEAAPEADRRARYAELGALPERLATALTYAVPERAAELVAATERVLVTGRGVNLATAQELALKLQETTAIMGQAWSPADLLHGPIAAAGRDTPLIVIDSPGAPDPSLVEACAQAQRRGAHVLLLGPETRARAFGTVPDAVTIPTPEGVEEWLTPLSSIVVAQRLVGEVAARRGSDVDRPEGLRKVTETT
jgi:glutamine---fructose-6-phosphate transaminase (isomerizing)